MNVVVVAARDNANPCEEGRVSAVVRVVGTAAALMAASQGKANAKAPSIHFIDDYGEKCI
jgi:hypothetical protein